MKPKVAIAMGLFALAGFITYLNWGSAEELPDEDLAGVPTPYKCTACDKRVDLKDAEYLDRLSAVDNAEPLICDSCAERKVHRLYICVKCSTEYFGADVPGSPGQCPKCMTKRNFDVGPAVEEQKKPRALSF